jgi:WD40 repeat protein
VASCGRDGVVRLWSADKGEKQAEFLDHKDDVFSLAFHPTGAFLVSGDLHGVIHHWDLATGKSQRTFDARSMYLYDRIQDVGGVRCLAFARNGALLLAAGSKPKSGGFVEATPLLLAFDWATGQVKHTLAPGTERDGFVLDLAWHADGFVMVVTSGQPGSGKLLFSRLEDAQPFFTAAMANCHSLAVHPDGSRLIVSATNANSSGNGRVKGENKEYPGNFSPLHVWELPKPAKP